LAASSPQAVPRPGRAGLAHGNTVDDDIMSWEIDGAWPQPAEIK
jgi:hypothetical protein